jgi:hypothetical protein
MPVLAQTVSTTPGPLIVTPATAPDAGALAMGRRGVSTPPITWKFTQSFGDDNSSDGTSALSSQDHAFACLQAHTLVRFIFR